MKIYTCAWCGSNIVFDEKKCSNCGAPRLLKSDLQYSTNINRYEDLITILKKIKKLLCLIFLLSLWVTFYFLFRKPSFEPTQLSMQSHQSSREATIYINSSRAPTSHEAALPLGSPVLADSQASLRNILPLSPTRPPQDLANGAEIVVLSGYEPSNVRTIGTKVKVVINRPKSKVLLVLTSYEKITWEVESSPKTKIVGIVASGYENPTVITTAQTAGFLTKLPYSYETENANFKTLLTKLNELFDINKVDMFRGSYSIPSLINISELDPPQVELTIKGQAPTKPPTNLAFSLIGTDFKPRQWTLIGPAKTPDIPYVIHGKLALSTTGDSLYKLTDKGIDIISIPGNVREIIPLPPNFPEFSWAMDIAVDTKRDIVAVVSLGGEGFLYRLDAKRKSWIDFRSLNNIDLFSLAYDAVTDRYVGWTDSGSLVFISGNGEALFSKNIIDRLPGFGRLYDRGNQRTPGTTIVPKGNDIALIYIAGNIVRNIWYYNLASDQTLLTYQNE